MIIRENLLCLICTSSVSVLLWHKGLGSFGFDSPTRWSGVVVGCGIGIFRMVQRTYWELGWIHSPFLIIYVHT